MTKLMRVAGALALLAGVGFAVPSTASAGHSNFSLSIGLPFFGVFGAPYAAPVVYPSPYYYYPPAPPVVVYGGPAYGYGGGYYGGGYGGYYGGGYHGGYRSCARGGYGYGRPYRSAYGYRFR
jgi:hypothetical protein